MAEACTEEAVLEKEKTIPASSSHVVQDDWSTLPRDVLVDKIKGVIYGQAIGDAIGLATEFLTKKQCLEVYGKAGPGGYQDIVQDYHRSRWQRGDWTDDTDQMLLIMLSIIANEGRVDHIDFAQRIHKWMNEGFKEFGDIGGMGIGMTVGKTLRHEMFLSDPHTAAFDVWDKTGRYLAANGAIMRTSILGILNFNDLDKVVENTVAISKVTHADPRCTASCVACTTAIALMLQGKYDPFIKKGLASLVEAATQKGLELLPDNHKEIKSHINVSSWKKLELDDKDKIGYTYKALGSGFYGLRTSKDFRSTIIELIMEGGDADSNGAVCGALVGCKFGFSQLPEDLLQFPHREWLDSKVNEFLTIIGLK